MKETAVEIVDGVTIENLTLPGEFHGDAYQSAVKLDGVLGADRLSNEQIGTAVQHYHTVLGGNALLTDIAKTRMWDLTWPNSWYIPGAADYRDYWLLPPPSRNRYGHQWKSETYNNASSATGEIFAFRQLRPVDRHVSSEAGIGILYSPAFSYGVVSLRPDVSCRGDTRWWQMLDQPVAGYSHVKTSLILAMWHQVPGGWDLMDWRNVLVGDGFQQSGSGGSAVSPYQRSFKGADLATKFVVQGGRTYLFGVVARVSILSTLTDSRGHPLPDTTGAGQFKIWGTLGCKIRLIELREDVVYIR